MLALQVTDRRTHTCTLLYAFSITEKVYSTSTPTWYWARRHTRLHHSGRRPAPSSQMHLPTAGGREWEKSTCRYSLCPQGNNTEMAQCGACVHACACVYICCVYCIVHVCAVCATCVVCVQVCVSMVLQSACFSVCLRRDSNHFQQR